MRRGPTQDVLRNLRTLYCCGVVAHLTDEQLLERFTALGDGTAEEAFAALLQRHGPMVYGVCLRVLGDTHEAEDAFQATFLVLARKARSVIRREKLASWLYGVAYRTAGESRSRAVRRRAREVRVSKSPLVDGFDNGFDHHELRAIIDEELAHLPARDRDPIVLCELEGLSRQEAARRLGVAEGTLSSRLARAKARLKGRLAHRGLAAPMAALSMSMLREATALQLPDALTASTTQAAMRVAAGISAAKVVSTSVASLTEGVLKAMLVAKLKGTFWALGTVAVVVSGTVVLAQSPGGGAGTQSKLERASEMERKLDRILSALDKLSGAISTQHDANTALGGYAGPSASTRPGMGTMPATPATGATASTSSSTAAVVAQTNGKPATVGFIGTAVVSRKLPLNERLDAAEREIQLLKHRLLSIEQRLGEVHQQLGQATAPAGAGDNVTYTISTPITDLSRVIPDSGDATTTTTSATSISASPTASGGTSSSSGTSGSAAGSVSVGSSAAPSPASGAQAAPELRP
jgi:RNA polymerase sigma factor (sigma-70 family)